MTKKRKGSKNIWKDSDDAPAWTDAQLRRAELAEDGKVLKPASGTLMRTRGRPRKEAGERKELVRIRLSPEVTSHFRTTGQGWQTRIDEALKWVISNPLI